MTDSNLIRCIFLSLLLLNLASCSKHSTLGQLTAASADKQGLLGERLDKFGKAVYWGNLSSAISFVEPQSQHAFGALYSRRRQSEEVVEVKIRDISFEEDSGEADVVMETQFYTKPTLYVGSRFEKQRWVYSRLDGGWLLRNAEIVSKSDVPKLEEVNDEPKQLF